MTTLRIFLWVLLLNCGASPSDGRAAEPNRGIQIVDQWRKDGLVPAYHALIIGINAYEKWPPLKYARPDAQELARLFQSEYSFASVRTLLDQEATRQKIEDELRRMVSNLNTNDAVVVFFAGHGSYDAHLDSGYWIPAEGGVSEPERPLSGWLPNSRLREFLGGMKAKHVLVVSDSCFSGSLLGSLVQRRGQPIMPVDRRALVTPSRLCFASTDRHQTASDKSLFAEKFLEALRNPKQSIFTIRDVDFRIRAELRDRERTEQQVPILAPFSDLPGGDSSGDFVFINRRLSPEPPPIPPLPDRFTNSLGMVFVRIDGLHGLFSIWETRVQDYDEFVREQRIRQPKPDFSQGGNHPVVNVSWNDAQNFCDWLTNKERREGVLREKQRYRLPTDEEWSKAAGLEMEEGYSPRARAIKWKGRRFIWGESWPPPQGAGNFAGRELGEVQFGRRVIKGYQDSFCETSPVGVSSAVTRGIYDLNGNVWEWCMDWFDSSQEERTCRGGGWNTGTPEDLQVSHRRSLRAGIKLPDVGFRCVLAPEE